MAKYLEVTVRVPLREQAQGLLEEVIKGSFDSFSSVHAPVYGLTFDEEVFVTSLAHVSSKEVVDE